MLQHCCIQHLTVVVMCSNCSAVQEALTSGRMRPGLLYEESEDDDMGMPLPKRRRADQPEEGMEFEEVGPQIALARLQILTLYMYMYMYQHLYHPFLLLSLPFAPFLIPSSLQLPPLPLPLPSPPNLTGPRDDREPGRHEGAHGEGMGLNGRPQSRDQDQIQEFPENLRQRAGSKYLQGEDQTDV